MDFNNLLNMFDVLLKKFWSKIFSPVSEHFSTESHTKEEFNAQHLVHFFLPKEKAWEQFKTFSYFNKRIPMFKKFIRWMSKL